MKYESRISFGSKDIAKVKFFQKWVKSQGQGHEVKNFVSNGKVLPQEIHLKYESRISFGSKDIAKVKFFQK